MCLNSNPLKNNKNRATGWVSNSGFSRHKGDRQKNHTQRDQIVVSLQTALYASWGTTAV